MPQGTGRTETSQDEVVAFLSDPATHGSRVSEVERIDTHISVVFLAGERVFKLKRALTLPFLDYGTVEKRRFFCMREVALNRRSAPELYRGVRAITRDAAGRLALDGDGEAIDWVVEMVRFDARDLFSARAQAGTLSVDMVRDATDAVIALHGIADVVRDDRGGDETGMAPTISELRGGLSSFDGMFGAAAVRDYIDALEAADRDCRDVLAARFDAGWIRICHGDLHLNNICMFGGRPTLFDVAEANERFMRIDVLYDLAFLLMDLEFLGLERHANAALNRYAAWCEDPRETLAGLRLLPLFLSLRAAIRAEISALTADRVSPDRAVDHVASARRYFTLAQRFLEPSPAALVAIGGASGTGKSTVARELAPDLGGCPGAVVVRSDEVRKALFGTSDSERLPDAAYSPEWHARTYDEVLARVRTTLAAGHACVVDAVHGAPDDRAQVERLALDLGVPFQGLWLDAPLDVLCARVEARTGDASDADRAVVVRQVRAGFGDVNWTPVDASGASAEAVADARAALARGPAEDSLVVRPRVKPPAYPGHAPSVPA